MSREHQESFAFDEKAGSPEDPPEPLADLVADVAKLWRLPLGSRVTLRLRDPALPELTGKLLLGRAPDLPLDLRQPLALRLSGVDFTDREIAAWSLC